MTTIRVRSPAGSYNLVCARVSIAKSWPQIVHLSDVTFAGVDDSFFGLSEAVQKAIAAGPHGH